MLQYLVNIMGPNMVPCGTPESISPYQWYQPLHTSILTLKILISNLKLGLVY